MQMGMRSAPVATCKVVECSYNKSEACMAPSITVGDHHPMCDMFTTSGTTSGGQQESHVGECKVDHCTFNASMKCGAPGITVNHHGGHADCETYRKA